MHSLYQFAHSVAEQVPRRLYSVLLLTGVGAPLLRDDFSMRCIRYGSFALIALDLGLRIFLQTQREVNERGIEQVPFNGPSDPVPATGSYNKGHRMGARQRISRLAESRDFIAQWHEEYDNKEPRVPNASARRVTFEANSVANETI